jgi:hypothetical protein
MTTIGTITIDTPATYARAGYEVTVTGCFDDAPRFNQLREAFAKADYGTAVHAVPGGRPYGEDMTKDEVLTVYCTWTHGTEGKIQDGWYLLRPPHSFIEDETPEGHSYVFSIRLFFLGTDAYYQACYDCLDMEALDSDWDI